MLVCRKLTINTKKASPPAAEPFFVVFCFRQDYNIPHTHKKQCSPHVKRLDAVKFSVTVFICLLSVLYYLIMVEIDEDPQLGLDSDEDDEELSDDEVRI